MGEEGVDAGEIRRGIFAVVGEGFIFVYSPQDKSSGHVPICKHSTPELAPPPVLFPQPSAVRSYGNTLSERIALFLGA